MRTETPFHTREPLIKKVEVKLEGEAARTLFLVLALDTGATNTFISWDAAYALGYDPAESKPKKRIITGSGVEYAPLIRVKSVKAFGIEIKDLEVVCHDLPEEASVDGLLGLNFLKNFDFCINYSKGMIEVK